MNWVEFFKKALTKSFYIVTKSTTKLYNHFLARSFREKGMKCNLTASSPSWGMRIMRHTSSNSLKRSMHLPILNHKILGEC